MTERAIKTTLRPGIVEIISYGCLEGEEKDSGKIADEILSYPSGLRAVSECCMDAKLGLDRAKNCPSCHGTGLVSRDIPISEAVEFGKECVKYLDDNFSENDEHVTKLFTATVNGRVYFLLPSGERVEVVKIGVSA